MSNEKHTQGRRLTIFVDPHQGSGTTAFEQYAEGNNGAQFDIKIVDERGECIATVPAAGKSGYSKVFAHQNARRLVACWNACEDVPIELLEEHPAPFSELRAQRDELLTALERAERKLSAYVGVCTGDKELTDAVLPMARAAIAKVKGGAA